MPPPMTPPTTQLARTVNAEITRATSRNYRIDLHRLDPESLREMLRFLRDVDHEKRSAVRRAQLQPWRRP